MKSNEVANKLNEILVQMGAGVDTDKEAEFDQNMNAVLTGLSMVLGRYLNHYIMLKSVKFGANPTKLSIASVEAVNDIIAGSATDSMNQIMGQYESAVNSLKKGH